MRPINLLPRGAAPQGPRLPIMLGAAFAAWILVLAFATISAQGRVDEAERKNQDAQIQIDRLTAQVVGLTDVRDTIQEYDEAVALVTDLLANDVSWGGIMLSLSSEIPSRVWLEAFTGMTSPDAIGGVGHITMTGVAFDFPDVSSWIRTLDAATFAGVSGAWVQNVSEATVGAADVVVFSSTTELTEEARSSRLSDRVPEVR
jgi:Tfp pilus assembly protein PilN